MDSKKEEKLNSIEGREPNGGKKKEVDLTLFLLRQAIGGVFLDSKNRRLIVVFKNEIKALEFINDSLETGPVYYFNVHGKKNYGKESLFLDKRIRRVAAYAKKEGLKVILSDEEKKLPHEKFFDNFDINIDALEIFMGDYGQRERLKVRDIKEMEKVMV